MAKRKVVSRGAKKSAKTAKSTRAKGRKAASKTKAAAKRAAPAKRSGTAARQAGASEKARAVELLEWVHKTTIALIDGFPADKATFQTSPTDTHQMWTLGHLATSYSWFASLVDGQFAPVPENYLKLFGYQSKPTGNAADYPPFDEVRACMTSAYQRLVDAIAGQGESDLHRPTATDSHGFAKDRLDVVYKTVWHDGWHSGQISTLRRALELPALM